MLDWHPNVLSLPREMPFLRQAFQKNSAMYFRHKFATEIKEKQSVYFFKKIQDENLLKLKIQLGFKISTKINTKLFKRFYLKKIKTRSSSHILQKVCNAVGFAMLNSSNKIKKRYKKHPEYLVIKNPIISEKFAIKISEVIPEARFIHIIRDPISRMASMVEMKKKLLKQNTAENNQDEIAVWSRSTFWAMKNERIIGPKKYRVICFENLLSNPKKVLEQILDETSIKMSNILFKPTMIGVPISANSSFASGGVEIVSPKKLYHHELLKKKFSKNLWKLLKFLKSASVEINYYHSKLLSKKSVIYKIVELLPRWVF